MTHLIVVQSPHNSNTTAQQLGNLNRNTEIRTTLKMFRPGRLRAVGNSLFSRRDIARRYSQRLINRPSRRGAPPTLAPRCSSGNPSLVDSLVLSNSIRMGTIPTYPIVLLHTTNHWDYVYRFCNTSVCPNNPTLTFSRTITRKER